MGISHLRHRAREDHRVRAHHGQEQQDYAAAQLRHGPLQRRRNDSSDDCRFGRHGRPHGQVGPRNWLRLPCELRQRGPGAREGGQRNHAQDEEPLLDGRAPAAALRTHQERRRRRARRLQRVRQLPRGHSYHAWPHQGHLPLHRRNTSDVAQSERRHRGSSCSRLRAYSRAVHDHERPLFRHYSAGHH